MPLAGAVVVGIMPDTWTDMVWLPASQTNAPVMPVDAWVVVCGPAEMLMPLMLMPETAIC